MLKLYAGRENIDKERFVYDRIKEAGGETLVLVPNQYTLVAEEQALRYLGTDCLFDTEILSMNRLGLRILTEKGTESVRMLDKYGRYMLLTRIIKEHASEFEIFRRSAGKLSFTSMLNDFISEFKQQDCREQQLSSMLQDAEEYPLLSSKLRELQTVVSAYEEAVRGRYTDPEDYISMYIDAISGSKLVRGKSIWIYGYDSITPKFANAVMELSDATDSVNFIVNRSDFALDEQLIAMLRRDAAERGVDFSCEEIDEISYLQQKSETIERIERGLWAESDSSDEREAYDKAADLNDDFVPEDLTLVCAANPYYEAESAAAYVWHLVRDLGYRMRDIQLIANDEGNMQPIVRRVFAEYGLPVFSDAVRDITDTASVAFIVNLLRFEIYNKSPGYLFAMLKTGMSEFDDEDVEELENYVRNYRIRGSMWDREFKYGTDSLGEERFARLDEMRAVISARMKKLKDLRKCEDTARFVKKFREYLRDEWQLKDRVAEAALLAEEEGLTDEAQRLTQGYDKAIDMLDQIVEILGDEAPDLAEFTELYMAGLSDVEVGVIPATADGLSLGTMIRTRPGQVRAVVVMGANEGVLPLQPSTEGLFSIDEKDFFKSKGFPLGALDDIHMNEENAAMYRMMSKASDKLYISYALTDTDGKDASPSPVIEALGTLFPKIREKGFVKRDIISEGFGMDMMNTPEDGLRHLFVHKNDAGEVIRDAELTRAALKWYRDNRPAELDLMDKASSYTNDPRPLGKEVASGLFARHGGKLILSSSAIGTYFDCPFKYYVDRGLRPEEEREFTTDSRSVGDVYHDSLMAIAKKLLGDKETMQAIRQGDDELLRRLVDEELARLASEYRGGLFISGGAEKYRLERVREICAHAALAMAKQLGADSVKGAAFEEEFGRHGVFEPIKLKVGDEEVYVEGRIDRSDILDVGGEKRIRIIDYKTGSDKLELDKMRQGLHMQLMIYLISASSGEYEPAGMFYFNIKDPIEAMNNKTRKNMDDLMAKEPDELFKLKGAYINEEGVLGAMPGEVLARAEKESPITREEYESIRHDVMKHIEKTAAGILRGEIGIHPFREGQNKLSCNYCSYKSICRRDPSYTRNYSHRLTKENKG